MKKVIVVNATYHYNGSCCKIAEKLAAEIPDAEVQVVNLKETPANPCLGCNACKAKETPACVQKDAMGALIEKIDACDAFVLAAPIYFGGICGQAKTFVDRLYCFYNPAKPGASIATKRGKKGAIVCTCAAPGETYLAHAQGLAGSLGIIGADETKAMVLGGGTLDTEENAKELAALVEWLGA